MSARRADCRFSQVAVLVGSLAALLLGGMAPRASAGACPNESLRTGASATLPDCRAYELVSPPETNGRSFQGLSVFNFSNSHNQFPSELITRQGDSLVFTTWQGPVRADDGATGTLDVYEAARTGEGWEVARRLSPAGTEALLPIPGGISSDHLYAFTFLERIMGLGALAADTDAEYLGSSDGSFEPTGIGSVGGSPVTEPLSQGRYISDAGQHVIFSTGHLATGSFRCFEAHANLFTACPVRLADDAPPEGTGAVYDRSADGPTRVVSLLPGPTDPTPTAGEDAAYQGVSQDGATVAFKIGAVMYVRVPDSEDGHTLEVAEGDPVFAGLSADGRFLFYVAGGESGDIHRYDTSDGSDEEVNATGDGQVVNVSTDGSHVYFISASQIDGHGSSGSPNLYVWGGGSVEFIATVGLSDLESTSGHYGTYPNLTNWTDWAVTPGRSPSEEGPGAESSRTTPDGQVLIFESKAKLTNYENADHTEIYRWDGVARSLACISCNPAVEPAIGDAQLQNIDLVRPVNVLHNLSDDGRRVFFETTEALAAADVDGGVNDAYEWQEDGGTTRAELISSGKSVEVQPLQAQVRSQPAPNVIFAITPSGSDLVFLSQDELVAGAGSGGAPALYDARVGGGFPATPVPSICHEEGCKPLPADFTPSLGSLQSETISGIGNVKPQRRKNRKAHCRRKKHKRCGSKKSQVPTRSAAASTAQGRPEEGVEAMPAGNASDISAPEVEQNNSASTTSVSGGEVDEFEIEAASAGLSTSTAGAHADFETFFRFPSRPDKNGDPQADARVEEVHVSLPPGLLGNPVSIPRCTTAALLAGGNCRPESQVGITRIVVAGLGPLTEPVYNLEPVHPEREVARLGFYAGLVPVYIDVKVRTSSDYGVDAVIQRSPGQAALVEADTTLWGSPSNPVHDSQRLNEHEAVACFPSGSLCEAPGGKRSVEPQAAFMTNPSSCQEGSVDIAAKSYQSPGQLVTASAPLTPITPCQGLPFDPGFSAEPTSRVAGAPTGLKTTLVLPQHLGPDDRATATMREARVTLPAGMQVAAGAANWIGTCSEAQVGYHEEVDAACPDASKLGTATIESPALSAPLQGNLYQRSPSPGHQLGLWLVTDALGLHVKLPGELQPDPVTGRLTAVFSDLPQVPVARIELNVWGGDRAPLQNPDRCGAYATDYTFFPHSQDPAVSGRSEMTIDQGCEQSFDPKLSAGITEPAAGRFSPFVFDLTRGDGQQPLRGFELELPDGELAKLSGVPLCRDAAAAAGTCPADSAIGHVLAATGPGPEPLWVPQPGKPQPKVYLAGPHEGSPFSVVTVVPAQAGPFDLGNVIVRSGLSLNPETNRAVVKADPLPQFFEGVGLSYRRLRAVVDRPGFSLNPTDCRPMQVDSTVFSTGGAVAHPAARFQVDGCKQLQFNPSLSLKLRGGTKRSDYPALIAVLKARQGDANIESTSVALPHTEFLAQEHIGTICTRKQFAAHSCPKGSVYGTAKAWTPLLSEPLQGPVFLRSSDHQLPDLVVALGGQLDVNLVGRIDSHNGGIRTTFEAVPDAPVTRFVLKMNGGRKGLLTNSVDLCLRTHRAHVRMRAQNGRALARASVVKSVCRRR